MLISALCATINIIIIVSLLTVFRSFFEEHLLLSIVIMIVVTIISVLVQITLETNADRKFILEMVEENKVALCSIQSGTYYKTIKDVALNKYNLWKLECTAYNDDMEAEKIEIIEKFSPHQTSIPTGYCYITYDETKQYLIIPNAVIGSFPNLKEKIEHYEKKMKSIKYLNVFYSKGLRLQTFQEALKEHKEQQELIKELYEE
ncbi:MAG: hypothetical protein HUJ57_02675 [Erysipelotrichaceae bacterium]|nr:hypothetical protein [Erysipelotrichaceae bacterium]